MPSDSLISKKNLGCVALATGWPSPHGQLHRLQWQRASGHRPPCLPAHEPCTRWISPIQSKMKLYEIMIHYALVIRCVCRCKRKSWVAQCHIQKLNKQKRSTIVCAISCPHHSQALLPFFPSCRLPKWTSSSKHQLKTYTSRTKFHPLCHDTLQVRTGRKWTPFFAHVCTIGPFQLPQLVVTTFPFCLRGAKVAISSQSSLWQALPESYILKKGGIPTNLEIYKLDGFQLTTRLEDLI